MTNRLERLNEIQDEAVMAWSRAGYIGTLNLATGLGKTITAFKCLYHMSEMGDLLPGARILFLAETTARRITLDEEIDKFHEITGKRVSNDFTISFACYQSLTDEPADLVILDEIHDAMTPKYMYNLLQRKGTPMIGLTATTAADTSVFRDRIDSKLQNRIRQSDAATAQGIITEFANKGQLFEILCPVVYRMGVLDAISEGLLSPFETYIISHSLNYSDQQVIYKKGRDGNPVMGSEKEKYQSYANKMKDYTLPDWQRRKWMQKATSMLYNLESKVEPVKALIDKLTENNRRVVVFGVQKPILEKIMPGRVCHSKNTEQLVADFNEGRIDSIGSARMLKQGITLRGVDACILVSYYSRPHNLEQILGRIIRYTPGKTAKLFIVVTNDTKETHWIKSALKMKDNRGNPIGELDLNFKGTLMSRDLMPFSPFV